MLIIQLQSNKPAWVPLAVEPQDRSSLDKLVANLTQPIAITSGAVTGSIGVTGAPATGWCSKLSVDDDGLWAYVRFIDSQQQVAAEEGKLLLSGIVDPSSVDPTTGLTVGPRLRSIQTFPATKTTTESDSKLMTTMTAAEQATILKHLPEHLQTAITRPLGILACVHRHIPGAAQLSYDECWKKYVHPVNAGLVAQELGTKIAAGTVRAAVRPSAGQRVQLDVRTSPGRNPFERLLNSVKQEFPNLSHDDAFKHACDLNRSHEVVG